MLRKILERFIDIQIIDEPSIDGLVFRVFIFKIEIARFIVKEEIERMSIVNTFTGTKVKKYLSVTKK